MTELTLILIIAVGLLLVVGRLLRDALGKRGASRDDFSAMEPNEDLHPLDVPPAALMDRIFAEDDLSFVSGGDMRLIRQHFLRDRRRIALSWLERTRREAIRILRLHLRSVRAHRSLRPALELQILAHTLLFFAVYALLWSIVATYGAFWARGFVRNVVTLAGRLSGLGARILEDAGFAGPRLAQSHGHV
jgi:hypothetical protein